MVSVSSTSHFCQINLFPILPFPPTCHHSLFWSHYCSLGISHFFPFTFQAPTYTHCGHLHTHRPRSIYVAFKPTLFKSPLLTGKMFLFSSIFPSVHCHLCTHRTTSHPVLWDASLCLSQLNSSSTCFNCHSSGHTDLALVNINKTDYHIRQTKKRSLHA